MAITRAQQAKQMLQNGGMLVQPGFGGARQGYRGDDAYGGGSGNTGNTGNTGGGPTGRDRAMGLQGKTGRTDKSLDTGGGFGSVDRSKVGQFSQFGRNVMAQNLKGPSPVERAIDFYKKYSPVGLLTRGLTKFGTKFGPTTTANLVDRFGYPTDVQGFGRPSSIGPTGPDRGDEGGKDMPLWMQLGYSSEAEYNAAMARGAAPAVTEDPPVNLNRMAYRLMAEGGAVMDDEPRQAYGLGSIVKKATRAIKKVAKSDLGKLALLYAGTAGLSSLGAGGGFGSLFKLGTYAPGAVKANLATSFARLAGGRLMADPTGLFAEGQLPGKQNLLKRAFSKIPGGVTTGILAVSALPFLMGDEKEEEERQLPAYLAEGIEIPKNQYRLMAEGGSTEEKEPVAKKVMPLIDMDGKEKDYRETGGFVDIGRMEKADDVPARLSKNEFVFTADAVRNAGDGSVDKGAEVMYNMMKNLEAGGEVSEESQGLEGARQMFKTSQRLEEVL